MLKTGLGDGKILGIDTLVNREPDGGELLGLPSCVDALAVINDDAGAQFFEMLS